MGIRIGKAAPDFTAQAYWRGEISEVRLSDYRSRWVLLFFYPADFTFV
jgi:peroxiredoxin (alkyl hydroperoxide reductase subunit C)